MRGIAENYFQNVSGSDAIVSRSCIFSQGEYFEGDSSR
jgi:hypothetical protein